MAHLKRILDAALQLKLYAESRVPKKYVGVLPYLLVVLVAFYSTDKIDAESVARDKADRKYQSERAVQIAAAARQSDLNACERGNELRASLRVVVRASRPNLEAYHREGLLNDRQYKRAVKQQKDTLQRFAEVDCERVVKVVPTPPAQKFDKP